MSGTVPPAFPPNPTVGQIYLNWVWNGSAWVCRSAGPVSMLKYLTTSQTYWPGPGTTFALVEVMGAGGGGGGALATVPSVGTAGWIGGAGGGGSGGYSRSIVNAALLVNGVIVTIGTGGTRGNGTTSGGNGSDTTFGALVVAHGGQGGQYWNLNNVVPQAWGPPGAGGPIGSGDFAVRGTAGHTGTQAYYNPSVVAIGAAAYGGAGGSGYFGGAGGGSFPALPGGAGGYDGGDGVQGSGGDGAVSSLQANNHNGGAGGNGFVLVTEFAFGPNTVVQDCSGMTSGCVGTAGAVAVTEVPPGFQGPFPAAGPAAQIIGPRQWQSRMPALAGPTGWNR